MAYRATAKTESRRIRNRLLILDAARARVLKGGFSGLSVSRVAADAGLATGTFYRHFASKTELCTELFREASRGEVYRVQAAARGEESPTGRLLNAVRIFVSRALRGRHLAYALIAEPVDPELERERLIFRRTYAEVFEKLLEEGIETGDFTKQDPAVTATALVGVLAETLVGPLAPSVDTPDPARQKDLITEVSRLCLRAVGCRRNVT